MGNLRPFQIVLLAFFAALALGALILLGAYQASVTGQSKTYGDRVVVWGTFPRIEMAGHYAEITKDDKAFEVVTYEAYDEDAFADELVNAIAEGRGPDLIMLTSDQMVELRPKLVAIPYETLPLRSVKDTFVDGAEIFAFPEGTYAVPFAVDPLLLYWNRDLFASGGLATPPATWEDVVNRVVPNLVAIDDRRTILQSAIALGEYRNLENAKEILVTLAMQTGSKLIYLVEEQYKVGLDEHVVSDSRTSPLQSALEFFTDFSNANSPLYTWNRSQQNDKNAFLAGELAIYFGLASEYQDIVGKNPNLNFDAALMPQGSAATIKRTYGTFYGYAIPQSAPNAAGAYQVALKLASAEQAGIIAEMFGLVTARRDLIASGSPDPVKQTAMNAALIARSWLDPDRVATDPIFAEMVEGVVSNRQRIKAAVEVALGRITREF